MSAKSKGQKKPADACKECRRPYPQCGECGQSLKGAMPASMCRMADTLGFRTPRDHCQSCRSPLEERPDWCRECGRIQPPLPKLARLLQSLMANSSGFITPGVGDYPVVVEARYDDSPYIRFTNGVKIRFRPEDVTQDR